MDRTEKILAANLSPRYWRLDRFERYVTGTQYEGRQDWFAPRVETPLLERKPCVVYPIVDTAIHSHISFAMGEETFPEVNTYPEEGAFDPRFNLNEPESHALHEFIEAAWDQAKMKKVARELLHYAMQCGTAVAIVSVKKGRICIDTTKAKWCTPTFEAGVLTQLEIKYPYLSSYQEPDGRWAKRVLIYRRIIDAEKDVTYKPLLASETGLTDEADFKIATKIEHGLGFCPVVWYKFMSECDGVDDHDGHPIHEHILEQLDGLNFALSQKHRAALYATDPQIVEVGVMKDEDPGATGRKARAAVLPGERGGYIGAVNLEQARKKGPGIVWRYEDPNVKVSMLTLPGDALKAADDNAVDMLAKIKDSLFYNPINVQEMDANAWSGAALKQLARVQVEYCDMVRMDFGDGCLMPLTNMILRVCLAKEGVFLPGIKQVRKFIARYLIDGEWYDPPFELSWPEYFKLTSADLKSEVEAAVALLGAGVITKETAVKAVSKFYDIDSVEEYVKGLESGEPYREETLASRKACKSSVRRRRLRSSPARICSRAKPRPSRRCLHC